MNAKLVTSLIGASETLGHYEALRSTSVETIEYWRERVKKLRAQLEAALAATPSAQAGEGWQPIETAPRDGRPVWARGWNWGKPDNGHHLYWAAWDGDCWVEAGAEPSKLTFLAEWLPNPYVNPQPQGDATPQVSGGGEAEADATVKRAFDAFNGTLVPSLRLPNTLTFRMAMEVAIEAALSTPRAHEPARPDADRAMKDAVFACIAEGRTTGRYGGVMYQGGFASVTFNVEPAPTVDGGAVAWFCECDDPQVTTDHGTAQEYAKHVRVRPLIFGDHPAPAPDVARDACHDAITRALDEASVRDPTLRGMCLEVGLEAFTAAQPKEEG